MAFCTKCGAQLDEDVKFCPHCGELRENISDCNESAEKMDFATEAVYTVEDLERKDVEKNKLMASLAYIGILVLIPIVCAQKSAFARYHANQGLILWICSVAFSTVTGVIGTILELFGLAAIAIALNLIYLVFIVLAIMGIVNACNGAKKELPLIGKYKILK